MSTFLLNLKFDTRTDITYIVLSENLGLIGVKDRILSNRIVKLKRNCV